jgi:hypothetical protein
MAGDGDYIFIQVIQEKFSFGRRARKWFFSACVLLAVAGNLWGRPVPDPADRLGFFTTVADKLLRSAFPFGVTNIPVCSNGVFVYTPAVQRLLQLSANVCDAANTNFFPSVFRPLFAKDVANNIFIIGYLQVTNVSGTADSQLSAPYDVTQLADFSASNTPIADGNGPVNVYGVPWILGAKKGLPGFNQFSMVNAVQVTRKLQVTRTSTDVATATYATNQMYVMSISNSLGISFWDSYSNAYPRPVTVYASDVVCQTLTNDANGGSYSWSGQTNFFFGNPSGTTINSWPGSQWNGAPPNAIPSAAAFITNNWSFSFLNPSVYRFNSVSFEPIGSPTGSTFETTVPPLPQLPQFVLTTSNYLQAFILDSGNVIDYVQLRAPIGSGNLNQTLADVNYPSQSSPNTYFQWSTNAYQSSFGPAYGVINQLLVSRQYQSAPAAGGQWGAAPTVIPGDTTPQAESAYFDGFFRPTFQYQGQTFVNTQLIMQAPYTPTRTLYSSFLLQANDPLIHYLGGDLGSQTGSSARWASTGLVIQNGIWYKSDDPQNQPLPVTPVTPLGGHYQPWGQNKLMAANVGVDTNAYNLAIRDSLVWGPDSWNFPTNLLPSLVGLGQVHRGTPWQTMFLKSTNILLCSTNNGGVPQNVGTNTWMQWTEDLDANDAALTAPVNDWRLAGLLMSLLNSNNPAQLFSVNDPNSADWQNLFNGLVAYSNSAQLVFSTIAPQFVIFVIASNSPQASVIANAIVQAKASQNFFSIGDILAVSTLAEKSPFLNPGGTGFGQQQINYGITDWEYEAIPVQLLPLLRPDSFGTLTPANGGWNVSFSGADGYAYVLQTSTNLTDWNSVSTNFPVQGSFTVPVAPVAGSHDQFFRSVLRP